MHEEREECPKDEDQRDTEDDEHVLDHPGNEEEPFLQEGSHDQQEGVEDVKCAESNQNDEKQRVMLWNEGEKAQSRTGDVRVPMVVQDPILQRLVG